MRHHVASREEGRLTTVETYAEDAVTVLDHFLLLSQGRVSCVKCGIDASNVTNALLGASRNWLQNFCSAASSTTLCVRELYNICFSKLH